MDGGTMVGDSCSSAEELVLAPAGPDVWMASATGTTDGYLDHGPHCVGDRDRVYWFHMPAAGRFEASLAAGPSLEPVLQLTGPQCDSGEVACQWSGSPGSVVSIDIPVLPTGIYFLWVEALGSTGSGSYSLSVLATAPPGDTCASPNTLTFSGAAANITADTSTYANDGTATCTNASGADVFFRFTNPATQNFTAAVSTQSATYRPAVYLLDTCGAASLACSAAPSDGASAIVSHPSLPAGDYLVVVDGVLSSAGPFELSASLTPLGSVGGESCLDPTPLTFTGTTTQTASVSGSTTDSANNREPGCITTTGGRDRVYTFTTTTTRSFAATATTDGSWLPVISLTASGCESGSELACNWGMSSQTISVSSLPPGTYFLWVDTTAQGNHGAYALDVQLTQ
jgi:hypothetical protein